MWPLALALSEAGEGSSKALQLLSYCGTLHSCNAMNYGKALLRVCPSTKAESVSKEVADPASCQAG